MRIEHLLQDENVLVSQIDGIGGHVTWLKCRLCLAVDCYDIDLRIGRTLSGLVQFVDEFREKHRHDYKPMKPGKVMPEEWIEPCESNL